MNRRSEKGRGWPFEDLTAPRDSAQTTRCLARRSRRQFAPERSVVNRNAGMFLPHEAVDYLVEGRIGRQGSYLLARHHDLSHA